MGINSNYLISENSINEFIRVLIPEAADKDIHVNFSDFESKIIIKIEIDGIEKEFNYENYLDKIDDQKVIILKTALLKFYEKKYPWGGLIGVRPTKVVKRLLNVNFSDYEIKKILKELYLVTDEKIELLVNIFKKELEIMNSEAYSVYIGIPFCPTKCRYCSFASFEVNSPVWERYYKGFVETLLEEIELTGQLIKDKGMKIESIYIGGGTPSTLLEGDLEKILIAVNKNIDMSNLKEFTFEAGREDSITDKKLHLAKEYGVDRISLNPQTFNTETLKKINRNFNKKNFDRCYKIIKEIGFIINMDLILGLPDEDETDIIKTLEVLKDYDIENLTIHSLALKKSSPLYKDKDLKVSDISREKVESKVKELVALKGMNPYYIYRQKNSADWGENVGYAKDGFESIFNVEMIEENQSTLGLGGGAITKKITKIDGERDEIIRIVNPKEPATYINEMKKRFEDKVRLFNR
ncbi:MAG: coproporphyrinogen III oxidase [Fusobacteriaceae bacterium]|nr:coproporphyrinogen III oxidase [Fusobacteriaceae bacterium]MBP9509540.1 coproporphyrinogen III oxidase [Fusobacteriaceae bacterium]